MLCKMPLSFLVSLTSVAFCRAHLPGVDSNTKFMDISFVKEKDVDETLAMETSREVNSTRIALLEETLRPSFVSLPKDSTGRMGAQTARYLLHRYFLNKKGWLLKGLEPKGNEFKVKGASAALQKDWDGWVPNYLEKRFEESHNTKEGILLHDLTQVAASLEDLVHKEAHLQLEEVYESLGFKKSAPLQRKDAEEVIDMYLLVYLTSRNLTVANPSTNRKRLVGFSKKYTGFKEMHEWLEGVEKRSMSGTDFADFAGISSLVDEIGDLYPLFNDQECQDLKTTMMRMEGGSRKPGRIPLADFYNKSLYSHWRFTEGPEYLRDLGALDESDPHRPHVILSNYVSSFNNCLRATGLYAVCCRSPCETLMGTLEQKVAAPTASVERIVELVGAMSTDTVPARGTQLEGKLLERLRSLADKSGGEVPLHGRLFAQWMHHAFPRECPYPHKAGSTNPQTPDEWVKNTGKTLSVSEDEMNKIVNDFCPSSGRSEIDSSGKIIADWAARPGCTEAEDSELPWSDQEELLEHHEVIESDSRQDGSLEPAPHYGFLMLLFVPVVSILGFAVDQKLGSSTGKLQKKWRVVMAMVASSALAIYMELLDPRVALIGIVFYVGYFRSSIAVRGSQNASKLADPWEHEDANFKV